MDRQFQPAAQTESKSSSMQSKLLHQKLSDRDASLLPLPSETPPILHEALDLPIRTASNLIIQPKLTIGAIGDKYEQEADLVAAQVTQRLNIAQQFDVQQKISPITTRVPVNFLATQQVDSGVAITPDLEVSIQKARGSGQPLSNSVRQPMEQAFKADFSGIKIHIDNTSDQLNRSFNSQAFTTKQDIFFRRGVYNPKSQQGQAVIAHELTHVLQQGAATQQPASIVQRLMTRAQFVNSTQSKLGRRGKHNAALYNVVDPLLQNYATLNPNNYADRNQRMQILSSIEHAIYNWVRTKPHLARDSKHRQAILNLLNDVQQEHQNQIAQISAPGLAGAANELFIGDPTLTPVQHAQIQTLWDHLRNNTGIIQITETCGQSAGMPPELVPGFRNRMLALFARLLASPTGRSLIDEILQGKMGGVPNADPNKDLITVRPLRAAEIAMGRTVGAAGVKEFGEETMNPDQSRKQGIGSYVTYGRNLTATDVESRLLNGDPLLTPVFIGFGHELIHALHNLRGVNQKDMPITAPLRAIWSNPEERATIEPVAGPGVQGVPGIPGIISENQLRSEHGLPLRDSHH